MYLIVIPLVARFVYHQKNIRTQQLANGTAYAPSDFKNYCPKLHLNVKFKQ
jgi:hypothetical protein